MGMAGSKAPPFLLPGEHFAAALAFLAVGALGLVAVAPALASGFYPSFGVIATTHLFTLGWITTSIMGALYQFLPVALGQTIRSVRLAYVTFALYVPGLAAFVAGFALSRSTLMLAGAATFGTAVLLFVGNLAATLRRSEKRDVTWWALTFAAIYLVVTLLSGLALAGNLRWGFLGGGRFAALGVHLHVAIAGWVLLVMVSVAHRLLPMFLLSHGAGDRFAKAAVGLIAAGAGVMSLLHHAGPLLSRWLPALLLATGFVCFLAQARQFYRHRNRPALDPGCDSRPAGSSSWAPPSASRSRCSWVWRVRGSPPPTSSRCSWGSASSWRRTTTRSCRSWSGTIGSAHWRASVPCPGWRSCIRPGERRRPGCSCSSAARDS